MKRTLTFIGFFLGIIVLNAQDRERFKELSEETLKYFNQAKDCWDNSEDSCIPFYKKMVESAKKNKECVPCAEIELAKGYYYEYDTDSSIFHLNNVLKEAKNQKERLKWELEQDAYGLLGANYSYRGEAEKAVKCLIESGKRVDKLGNKEQSAIIKGNLGVMYNDMRNYEKGIEYQKTAIKELLALGKPQKTGVFSANIAGAYIDNSQPDSALVWGKRTIRTAIEQKDVASETAGYYLTGAAYERKNPDSALYYVNKSVPLAISTKNTRFLATSYNIKGNIYAQKGIYNEAKKYYLQSIEIYKSIGKPPGLYAPLKTLGLEAHRFKDYQTASEYMHEYIIYQDSVVSEDNRKLVHELNTKYETERKEKLLAEQKLTIEKQQNQKRLIIAIGSFLVFTVLGTFIFYRRNQKIREQKAIKEKENEVLTAFVSGEERERNRISHELHDSIASMIGVAKMNMETLPHLPENQRKEQEQKIIRILENTHSDIRHIAHNLLPVTLEKEGLVKAVEQFANEINQTGILKIKVNDNLNEKLTLSIQKQLMLFRIIQELVNNIIKHSQAHNAIITFVEQDKNLIVEITDDGIGFNGEITTESQGLHSIQQRISSVFGKFTFTKNEKNGMTAILRLALLS